MIMGEILDAARNYARAILHNDSCVDGNEPCDDS
jgi:hypothetical protein